MSSVHTIRLAGPWELHVDGAEPARVKLPAELPVDSGCLLRKFHAPSGLNDDCDVRIVLSVSSQPGSVRLNDQAIEPAESTSADAILQIAYDVKPLLQSFNSLCISRSDDQQTAVTVQSAVMEIREP